MPEEEKQASVPYFVHEGMMTKMQLSHEKTVDKMSAMFKTTVIALVIALAVCVASLVINDSLWRSHYDNLSEKLSKLVRRKSTAPAATGPIL